MATATDAQRAEVRELRRELRRRQVRRRRLTALGIVAGLIALGVGLGSLAGGGGGATVSLAPADVSLPGSPFPTPLPVDIRGVHVTMGLASLPGRLQQYIALKRVGLNTIELDVKDENGHVGVVSPDLPALARRTGAAGPYYDAERVPNRRFVLKPNPF